MRDKSEGSIDLGQFGGFNAGANVGIPGAGLSSGNDFLTNVATVAVPFFITQFFKTNTI